MVFRNNMLVRRIFPKKNLLKYLHTIYKLLTLYDALLMLTNRPRLVSVHFKRSIMSRCSSGLQSPDFDPLTTSDGDVFLPFNTSRSSS